MRLLVLSFYYQPDLSAGSFRATALVRALRARAAPGTHIEVLTTLPNRYHTFEQPAEELESQPGLEIRRIPLPRHRSDILGQSRAFARFARRAWSHVADREYDVVYATSSRLMTATLGAAIARRKHALLYLDIRDIFVDTIGEMLPRSVSIPVKAIFSRVEAWTVRRASRINLVSPGFEEYFRTRYGASSFAWFTNGIDDEFLPVQPEAAHVPHEGRATIVYAGNIGEGQGLHQILPALAHALRDRARFVVIGDGGRRRQLEEALALAGLNNVELRAPIPRPQLIEVYRDADVLLIHLGRHAAFEKVLPSKLFEYAALGKPVLAGVAGYAARFVREEISNAAVFTPCDARAAVAALGTLRLEDRPRPEFVAKYARSRIALAMADDVLALGRA